MASGRTFPYLHTTLVDLYKDINKTKNLTPYTYFLTIIISPIIMCPDFVITQRDDSFSPQKLILLVVVDPHEELSRLGLVLLAVRSNTTWAGESRREIYGYLAGDAILREIFADYVDTCLAVHFLTKVRLIVGVQTSKTAFDRFEDLFGFEEMGIIWLRIVTLL